ncbi:MAG: VIT1/CCC1 transporter family protein [Anaerolineae bacterium]|nr:VIT1/CCC1 transporter family protein [Anaerolineae bacterium]
MNNTGSKPTAADVARWQANWRIELEASALYEALAANENHPERKGVLQEMAAMEAKHATTWEEKLRQAGMPATPPQPGLRARLLVRLAPVLGARNLLGVAQAVERQALNFASKEDLKEVTRETALHSQLLQEMEAPATASPMLARETWHRSAGGGTLRAAVFGINDGLVSNLSLVMGVAGANPGPQFILLAGIAGLLAGAFSMAAGEYISVLSQREVFERQIAKEKEEIESQPEEEAEELALIYRAKGIPKAEAERLATVLMQNRQVAIDTLAREELGLDPSELGSPWGAALSSFSAFAVGAILPVLPYLLVGGGSALALSALLSGLGLFTVGASLSLFTGRGPWLSGLRMLLIGGAAAAVTFLVGTLLGVSVGG